MAALGYEIQGRLIGCVKWSIMRDTIKDFFSDPTIKPDETLLFYYSGHGTPDIDGEMYLSTSETDPHLPDKRGYSFNDLTRDIQRSTSNRIVAILDCCYSGAALMTLGTSAINNASRILKDGGKCILAASQGIEEAYVLEEHKHSLFTYYLLAGLRGDPSCVDARGYVTAYSLSEFIFNAIKLLPEDKQPKQQPITKIEASGEIILGHYPEFAKVASSKFSAANLGKVLTSFVDNAKKAHSHTAKQMQFSKFVRDVFRIEPEQLEMEVPISSQVPTSTEALIVRGRIDTVFGNLILEFKVSVKQELDDAKDKLKKYFQYFLIKYPSQRFVGIVTDDLTYIVFIPKFEKGIVISLQQIDRLDIEQKLTDPEFVYLWFDSYFFTSQKIIPTSIDIRKRFGIDSPTYATFNKHLSELFSQLGSINNVKNKFSNWQRYLEIVYGDKPSELDLFFNHTYLATLAKLLVYYRISGGRPITIEEIRKLIFGDLFRVYGITNLIEEDFFTWFFYKRVYDFSSDLVFRLAKELQIYDLDFIDEDILKELYQELVGTEVRHALGEYYTPDWLAEMIVEDVVKRKSTASFLDPACGSGTFLFSAIKYVIPKLRANGYQDEQILNHIIENIVGIDINPLAVIIARTNYLLALKDVIKSRKSSIRIPIYLSDSIKILQLDFEVNKELPHYRLDVGNQKLEIPVELAKEPRKLDTTVELMQTLAKDYEKDFDAAKRFIGTSEKLRESILQAFRNSLNESESVKTILINDLRTITNLIDQENDSIWCYILKNILRPVILSNKKFDSIVGNPPWLAMQFMKDPQYKEFLKKETFSYNLIDKKKTHLFTHMEMATLFFCRVSELYLEDKGLISFVMPKSVLTALHHANFMKFEYNKSDGKQLKLKLEKIYDLEQVRPLFNIPSCVLIAVKGLSTTSLVNMTFLEGNLTTRNEKWLNAESILKSSTSNYIIKSFAGTVSSPYYHHFFQGATLFPRNFWFIEFKSHPTFGFSSELPLVASDKDNDTKMPWRSVILEGNVEIDCIYATLIGKDILPFGYKRLRPIVMPLLPEDNKFVLMKSSQDALDNGYTNLAAYLEQAQNAWSNTAKKNSEGNLNMETPYIRLDYPQKNLTRQTPYNKFKVLYTAATTFLTSCVVRPDDPLNITMEEKDIRLKAFIAESKTYVMETDSEMEAYYLCAILNSKLVDDWIKPLQNKGDWGERDIHKRPLLLPIPLYNETNSIHSSIAKISKQCRDRVFSNLDKVKSKSIGRDRRIIRDLLKDEMHQLNELVKSIIEIK